MTNNPNMPHYEEDDDVKESKVLKDFDCPSCSANNPYDDGIHDGDEVRCYYCGEEFKAERNNEGLWKFRET
jgi:DNA-directed RNA polymerase subunit RPC12/RpoP